MSDFIASDAIASMSLASGTLSRIPDDILCELYAILTDVDPPRYGPIDYDRGTSSMGWIRLTHACRRLRLLGLGLPAIWGRIVCVFPLACQTILERSQGADVTLNLSPHTHLDYFELLPVFDILSRARHVKDRIDARSSSPRKFWWNSVPLPALQSLEVRTTRSALSGDPGCICAPGLRKYKVIDTFIPFKAPLLQSLELYHEMSCTELVSILLSCPLLTNLHIRKATPSSVMHKVVAPLPHLKDLIIHDPDDETTLTFLNHLSFPRCINFETYLFANDSSLLHALLAYPPLELITRDTLSITTICGVDGGNDRFHLFLSESFGRTLSDYSNQPKGGLVFETLLDEEDENQIGDALSHFLPSTAQSIRTLAFYAGQTFPEAYGYQETYHENWQDPLAVSDEAFAHIWRSLYAFENIETVYFSDSTERSISLLELHAEWVPDTPHDDVDLKKEKRCLLFPRLSTIVLDSRCQRMRIREWIGMIDVIKARQVSGHAIRRVVLMGGHLCHIITGEGIEKNVSVNGYSHMWTEWPAHELTLDALQRLVPEVVDLRDKGCQCEEQETPMRVVLPAQPSEFD